MNKEKIINTLFASSGVYVLLLLLTAFKLFQHYNAQIDLQLSDDGDYILYSFANFNKLHLAFGPSYSVYLKLFHLFSKNPVSIFLYNYVLLCTLFPLLLFLFFIRIKIKPFIAFIICFIVLTSEFNLNNQMPHVTHFVLCLFLMSLIVSTYFNAKIIKLVIFNFALLIACYARPELFLSFLLFNLWLIIELIKNKEYANRKNIVAVGLLFLFSLLLFINYKLPVSASVLGYNRSVLAYYQHDLISRRMHGDNAIEKVYYWDWISAVYGNSKNLSELISHYPKLFIQHIIWNVKLNAGLAAYLIISLMFPITILYKKIGILLAVLIGVVIIIFSIKKRKSVMLQFRSSTFYFWVLLFFSIPFFITCLLIFPRFHYMFAIVPLICFILVQAYEGICINLSSNKLKIVILSCYFLLTILTPSLLQLKFSFGKDGINSDLCMKKTVTYINQNFSNNKHIVYCAQNFVGYLNPDKFTYYHLIHLQGSNHVSYRHFLDSLNIDLIVYDAPTFLNGFIKADTSWVNITQQPEINGYRKINPGFCSDYYILKKE